MAEKHHLPPSTVARELILNVLEPVPAQAAARQRLVGEFEDYLGRLHVWEGFAAQYRKALGKRTGERGALAEFNRLLQDKLGQD